MKKNILFILLIIGVISIIFGFAACKSDKQENEQHKSAYERYLQSYTEKNGSTDGALSEEEWIASLFECEKSEISSVDIVCGSIIITYTDNSVYIMENACPEVGHNWNEGKITTAPTCVTSGVITYECKDCGKTKKEALDAVPENHVYGDYESNETHHWRTCRLCGNVLKEEHSFNGASKESDVNKKLECECGINKTVGEFYAFKTVFECSDGVSVIVYNSQNYSEKGTESDVAYSRSKTGELLNDGEGQVNFEVVLALGYKLKRIEVKPANGYKNLKGEEETGVENIYRITKITSDLVVGVEAEINALDLPVMVINTENSAPISDKENYVNCMVSVMNAENEFCFSEAGAGIRGRGNSSWGLPKKPYKLKFDSKIDLFGNGEAKKWTLIANYCDPSLIRNYLAYTLGAGFEGIKDTTTTVQFVELYLNGQYDGVYLICEQNEVGENRVNIDSTIKETNGEIKVDTGYLLECDEAYYEGIENQDYFVVNGKHFQIKSPDTENSYYIEHKTEFINFIKEKIQNAYGVLTLENSDENYEEVKRYVDLESFLDGYLIDELMNIADLEYSSFCIFYDPDDGKIHRGPIWDYDASAGNSAYAQTACNPRKLYASNVYWYKQLLKFDGFKELLKERLDNLTLEDKLLSLLDEQNNYLLQSSSSFERNFVRWNILGQNKPELEHWNTADIAEIKTWQGQIDYVFDWIKESFDYIVSVFC